MIVSIFLSLSHYALDIVATGNHVNDRDKYGLEIPTNLQSLHFIGLKRPLNWLKSKIKIEENLNETVKNSPKLNAYKFLAGIALYWTCSLSRGQS